MTDPTTAAYDDGETIEVRYHCPPDALLLDPSGIHVTHCHHHAAGDGCCFCAFAPDVAPDPVPEIEFGPDETAYNDVGWAKSAPERPRYVDAPWLAVGPSLDLDAEPGPGDTVYQLRQWGVENPVRSLAVPIGDPGWLDGCTETTGPADRAEGRQTYVRTTPAGETIAMMEVEASTRPPDLPSAAEQAALTAGLVLVSQAAAAMLNADPVWIFPDTFLPGVTVAYGIPVERAPGLDQPYLGHALTRHTRETPAP